MSLLIGIHIQEVLSNSEELKKVIDDRVYPLVVPVGVPKYPFIVFQGNGINGTGTKDGTAEDNVFVAIAIVSKAYGEAIRIANKVRYLFEGQSAKYAEFEVRDCEMNGSDEEYMPDIDAYVLTLQFGFKTLDY